MSIAEIERFIADLRSNESLRAEAEAEKGTGAALASLVAFAGSKGYAFTADEAKEHAKATATASRPLADAELGGVVGGIDDNKPNPLKELSDTLKPTMKPTLPGGMGS